MKLLEIFFKAGVLHGRKEENLDYLLYFVYIELWWLIQFIKRIDALKMFSRIQRCNKSICEPIFSLLAWHYKNRGFLNAENIISRNC